jgi:hypothetical protein
VLALQDLDPDNLAGCLIAVTFAEVIIQMLLIDSYPDAVG